MWLDVQLNRTTKAACMSQSGAVYGCWTTYPEPPALHDFGHGLRPPLVEVVGVDDVLIFELVPLQSMLVASVLGRVYVIAFRIYSHMLLSETELRHLVRFRCVLVLTKTVC